LHAGRDPLGDQLPSRRGVAGEPEEELPFEVGQAKPAGQRLDHLSRRRGRPALFEPGQVVDRDTGEVRELLAPQPRCPTPRTDRQADGHRRDPVAPAAYRDPELLTRHRSSVTPDPRPRLVLAVLRPAGHSLEGPARRNLGR